MEVHKWIVPYKVKDIRLITIHYGPRKLRYIQIHVKRWQLSIKNVKTVDAICDKFIFSWKSLGLILGKKYSNKYSNNTVIWIMFMRNVNVKKRRRKRKKKMFTLTFKFTFTLHYVSNVI